jgi:hypothetical protein
MADSGESKSGRRLMPILLAIAIPPLLLLLYVLSMGPVCYLQTSGTVEFNEDSIARFYFPVEWAGANCRPVGKALLWYLGLWTGQ